MHPKIVSAKKSQGISLPRAFAVALWARVTGKVIKKKNQTNNTGNVSSPNESNGKKATASANTVSAVRNGSQIGSTIGSHRRPYGDIEEEKTEIQADTEAPLRTDDFVEDPPAIDTDQSQ